ncbi:hypothetical protein BGZ46_010261 [Entomortierella lignicola]|nr:hypothetical protein BGZ46_010261 [Entomortierella lignicola]
MVVPPIAHALIPAASASFSSLAGSSKKKDADIFHARQRLLQCTSSIFEIVRLVNSDSPVLLELQKLDEEITLLEDDINNKGRTGLKKLIKPRAHFEDIWDRIAAIRAKSIDFSAGIVRRPFIVINSAEAIYPSHLKQLDNLLIQYLEHFGDNPRASLVIDHAPQPAIARIHKVDNTPKIVVEAENVELQPSTLANTNPQPKIVVLSGELCSSTDPKSKCKIFGELSYKNRRDYVAHHYGQYTLRDNFTSYFQDVVSQGFIPAWAKTQILVEELEKNEHAWIFWIDTDAFITDMDIQLEQFVDDSYSLLITKDSNFMNAGVFMLKVNDWSRSYMRDVLSRMENGSNEQDWMIKLLEDPKYEEQRQVKYLPQCSFNSYWKARKLYEMYRLGDVIHWAEHNFNIQLFNDWKWSLSWN